MYVQGPLRVFPGRLSVSKTFGDIEAKRPKYGGNPNVIVCEPDIKCFKAQDNFDFIMIGCDGIFEQLNNRDCIAKPTFKLRVIILIFIYKLTF